MWTMLKMQSEVVTFIISNFSRPLFLLELFSKSTFSEHILNAGHKMRPMEETMTILHFENGPRRINALEELEIVKATILTILHFENDPRRINALEELEIVKATTSDSMLNIVHHINPLYRIPHSVQDQTAACTDNS